MKIKHRFYIPPDNIKENSAIICLPEYHHVVDVLRHAEGDPLLFFDGKGTECTGVITKIDKTAKIVTISIIEKVVRDISKRPIVLVQALIKSGNMDLIIQKATELGVTNICPIITKNTVVQLGEKELITKIEKWNRIAEEACKQCKRSTLPVIDKIWNINEAVAALNWLDVKLICAPHESARHLKEISDNNSGSVGIMIGPEGDFTHEEIRSATEKGWNLIHLGETILRAETASIAMLGAVSYKFGYWDK